MIIVGHRGACGLMPENTIASFQKALDHKVAEIEFDLRITVDGKVVIHHDPFLNDGDGKTHFIDQLTYHELLRHKPDLVTFEQAIDYIGKKTPLYIEIKPGVRTQPITKIIDKYLSHGWSIEHFRVASFEQSILVDIRHKYPDMELIVNEVWSGMKARWRAKQINTDRISMEQQWLWSGFIRMMSKRYRLGTFALNDPKKAKRWAKAGLYAAITDYPNLLEEY